MSNRAFQYTKNDRRIIRSQDTDANSKRLVYIDLIESIAIFFVIVYHSRTYSFDILLEKNALSYIGYLFNTILSTCVPLFFFVNGYLLFNKKLNLIKHIKKTAKLVFLAIIWGAISLVILSVIHNEIISFKEFWDSLWTWKHGWIHYLWFLGALVVVYVWFPLLKQVYDTNKRIFIYFVIVCAFFTFGDVLINHIMTVGGRILLNRTVVYERVEFFNMFNPFKGIYGYSFVYFCVGGLMFGIKDFLLEIPAKKRNAIAAVTIAVNCALLCITGICYSTLTNELWDVVWNGYDTVFTFINVVCIFVLCLNWKRQNKFIKVISSNTLGIYLIHMIFVQFTIPFFKGFSVMHNIPASLTSSFVVLCICLAITLLLRNIPIIKKLVS